MKIWIAYYESRYVPGCWFHHEIFYSEGLCREFIEKANSIDGPDIWYYREFELDISKILATIPEFKK